MQLLLKQNRYSGIALLLTMVILSLVTIFMTEFFFETALEIRAIENFKSSFVSQTVVKSMFKAMLVAISINETDFFEYLKQIYQTTESLTGGDQKLSILNPPKLLIALPEGSIPDFESAVIFTPYVRPIDHLFNLNRIQSKQGTRVPDSPNDRIIFNQFVNLISQIPIKIEQEGMEMEDAPAEFRFLELGEATRLYAAIFDWMDTKDDGRPYSNEAGVTGAEDGAYTEFEVNTELLIKNRRLDRLTEIRLIDGIKESGIPYEEWKKHFTVHPVGVDPGTGEFESRLNVNLANKEEIVTFLRRFEQNSEYYGELGGPPENKTHLQAYVDHAEEVADALIQFDEDGTRVVYTQRSLGSVLSSVDVGRNYSDFFIYHNQWYEIRLVAEVDHIQSEIQAIVFIPRNASGEATGNAVIKDFILR
ncbi:MAG: general secretion pathway protein GspK [SAR324 cluster bacterium]|nr:general secretion pathway protein GspK [SAR324 cluster bacterium]